MLSSFFLFLFQFCGFSFWGTDSFIFTGLFLVAGFFRIFYRPFFRIFYRPFFRRFFFTFLKSKLNSENSLVSHIHKRRHRSRKGKCIANWKKRTSECNATILPFTRISATIRSTRRNHPPKNRILSLTHPHGWSRGNSGKHKMTSGKQSLQRSTTTSYKYLRNDLKIT
jgi:hypothetical protein